MSSEKPLKILRLPAVQEKVGLKTTAIYAAIKRGDFPRPIKLTESATGWPEPVIDAWIASRVVTEPHPQRAA